MNLIDKDALCKILTDAKDKKAEYEYTKGWNDGLFEAIYHAEKLQTVKEKQSCEECIEGETNCNNCANLGEVSICANGLLWIDDCPFYKPKNYCGNCGRKLVE